MPEICRFLGIVIGMYYKDHNPPPFHAYYGEHDAAIVVHDGTVLSGSLPRRAMAHVQEWRLAHIAELEADWQRARASQLLEPIEPLE